MTRTVQPHLNLSRARRRGLVVVQYTLMTLIVLAFLTRGLENAATLVIFLVAALASMVTHTTLAMSIQNIAQVRVHTLDERQRAARDAAFAGALRVLTAVLTVAWVYAMVASWFGLWLPDARELWLPLWLIAQLAYGLPTAIAAWNEPEVERE